MVMRYFPRALRTVCWLTLVLTLAPAHGIRATDGPDPARAEVAKALRSGQGVVLVVVADVKKPGAADESYGDWADNLNYFVAHADQKIKIIKLTARRYPNVMADPKTKSRYATLFIRDLSHVLLYDGMILESQVYKLGQAYILQHSDPKAMSAWGLQETTARLR